MTLHNDDSIRKILIVDDNPDIHNDFKTILNRPRTDELDQMEAEIFGSSVKQSTLKHSYELHFAFQGQEALDLVQRSIDDDAPFQMAFVDIRMPPGWDGLETIEKLWAVDGQLQVVLCTAYSDYSWEQINQRLHSTHNLLILKKPFDVAEVAQMANTLTQKWLMTKAATLKQDELETIVRKRTKELEQTNHQLEAEIEARRQLSKQLIRAQKMEAIGTLAAGVAHDLNNILAGIVGYPDLLLLELDPRNPMYAKLEMIQQSGRKAAAIVQDMLTLGRRAISNTDKVSLQKVVAQYLKSPEWLKTKSYHSHVNVESELDADASKVIGSELQLTKSLMNLVSNAAEAMNEPGTITIRLAACTLDRDHEEGYEVIPAGKYVVLSVSDTGEGITEKDLEHIFEPFYTKKVMGRSGTGLGLAVVWGAVRDHKGYVNVISRPGHGTTFDLYFPDSGIKEATSPEPTLEAPAKGAGGFVLVVDDVSEVRFVAMEMLKRLGYTVDAVDSGEGALSYLSKHSVDLLLLDMSMNDGMDGLETYQGALAINPLQRAVIASGYTKNERVEAALALGAASFVQKPYSFNTLAEAVNSALQNKN